MNELEVLRATVRDWCAASVPREWRQAQAGASDDEFVAFQQDWFRSLVKAGFAVPHWPAGWGGGFSLAEQSVIFEELARARAPRLVLHFVSIHHAAATLLQAGTARQREEHLPAILGGEVWCQGFSEPGAGSDLAALSTRAVADGDAFVVNGQKIWASGAMYAGWCLLLVRTDPAAPKRKGISYLIMDMTSAGVEVRPIKQPSGEKHFCEIFLTDVRIPRSNLIGQENAGWAVAQSTLNSERGATMVELAERLAVGFRWLLELAARTPGLGGGTAAQDPHVRERLAELAAEVRALRALVARAVSDRVPPESAGPLASVIKLYYSELLQRMTGYGAELDGLDGQLASERPRSAGWESGHWMLDYIGSWEWTIPGGTSEIMRTIIGERAWPAQGTGDEVILADSAEASALREAAGGLLADWSSSARVRAVVDRAGPPDPELDRVVAEAGWFGIEIPERFGGAGGEFTDMLMVLEAMGAATAATTLVGSAVLCAGAILAGGTAEQHRRWLPGFAAGTARGAVALPGVYEPRADERVVAAGGTGGGVTVDGRVSHVLGAAGAALLVLITEAVDRAAPGNRVVLVLPAAAPGVTIEPMPTIDATRHLARISLDHVQVPVQDVLATGPEADALVESIVNRAALAVAADSLGVAERVVTMTVAYAKQREQFGRPIGSFQAVKHRAADMFVAAETARVLVDEAGQAVAADPAGAGLLASMAKQYACAAAAGVAGAGLQLHGGIGYTWEHDLHLLLKRAKLNEPMFGGLSWHRRRAAALLLPGPSA